MRKVFTIFLILFSVIELTAQDGDLDATFGTNGIVITQIGTGNESGSALAIQSDGKLIVAGTADAGTDNDFAVVRYNTDGSLDNAFGTGGIATTSFGSYSDYGEDVAIQSDGKIVVVGYADNGSNYDFAVARYKTDGTLDNAFGTSGKVITPIGSGDDFSCGVGIQSDGKIVAAGYYRNGSRDDFAVVRYNTDGSLDSGFDSDGIAVTSISSNNDYAWDMAIQSDGKIVVVGYAYNASYYFDIVAVRFDTDGSLDSGFDGDGKKTIALGTNANSEAYGVTIQDDGKILIVGNFYNTTDRDFAVIRLNSDGSFDNSFDSNGIVLTAIGSGDDNAWSVVVQPDDKILVCGAANSGDDDFAVVRYSSNGSLDNTFGTGGKVTTAISGNTDRGVDIAMQSDGKIVVAGFTNNGSNNDFAVTRYKNDSVTPVELVSFSAFAEDNSVKLIWETATEVNNYGFEIQRSFDNKQNTEFETIGFVAGNGNSNAPKHYSFTDNFPPSGILFYRLKQIDTDGAFEYSNTIEAEIGQPQKFELMQNYPNPANPSTTIQYALPSEGFTTLKVYNAVGKEVRTLTNIAQPAGRYRVHFDATGLPSGIYFYQLRSGKFTETKKMILLK